MGGEGEEGGGMLGRGGKGKLGRGEEGEERGRMLEMREKGEVGEGRERRGNGRDEGNETKEVGC